MAPPVPIPNTEVKRASADDTRGETLRGKYATAREHEELSLKRLGSFPFRRLMYGVYLTGLVGTTIDRRAAELIKSLKPESTPG